VSFARKKERIGREKRCVGDVDIAASKCSPKKVGPRPVIMCPLSARHFITLSPIRGDSNDPLHSSPWNRGTLCPNEWLQVQVLTTHRTGLHISHLRYPVPRPWYPALVPGPCTRARRAGSQNLIVALKGSPIHWEKQVGLRSIDEHFIQTVPCSEPLPALSIALSRFPRTLNGVGSGEVFTSAPAAFVSSLL